MWICNWKNQLIRIWVINIIFFKSDDYFWLFSIFFRLRFLGEVTKKTSAFSDGIYMEFSFFLYFCWDKRTATLSFLLIFSKHCLKRIGNNTFTNLMRPKRFSGLIFIRNAQSQKLLGYINTETVEELYVKNT